ncbi:pilus assembly protein TadG-related protein [Myxococcus sp. K15C18031901]|uniref:pilus assembly protein TadG-related protein n=1 Tax=Myxococcus dinghuensis TaxID=2906761 RepID=UPI0020A6DF93|nr:pilus assembly protein TadG-related protein [Myxococcus dinghuensis]MCP3099043.1 pilus assembly protein TadG-related protein [Myxococcus dinghuensis]
MTHAPARGQTLVLFALGTLLLVLMVSLTLSFTLKVRERIELQTVTDATAYSNAVATARTFNNIAVMNRAQIGHAVAQAGATSLVSWASLYRAQLNAAKKGFGIGKTPYQARIASGCPCAWKSSWCAQKCRCGRQGVSDLGMLQTQLEIEQQRVEAVFQAMDPMVNLQMLAHQVAQGAFYASQQANYQELRSTVGDQGFANKLLRDVVGGRNPLDAAWVVPSIGDINKRELGGGLACTDEGAVCDLPLTVAHAVNAAMGSRGFHFVTHRRLELGDYTAHQANLDFVIWFPDDVIVMPGTNGTTYFGKPKRQVSMIPPYAPALVGDDLGSVFWRYDHLLHGGDPVACPASVAGTQATQATLVTSGGVMPRPEHTWTGGRDLGGPLNHMLVPCLGGPSSCPGIWPPFLDYNLVRINDEGNNFGQPKNFAVIQRDLTARKPDPWDLSFRYRFESGGSGSTYDARSFTLADGTPNGTQTALSTGIAYYHRGRSLSLNHWNEPPNLLNPYWRATLVGADIDDDGVGDALRTLNLSAPVAARTLQELRGAGFRGMQ